MKVALFTGNYNHIRDGVSLTLNRLVKFLQANGVDVLIFGPTIEEPEINHVGTLVAVPSLQLPGRPEYRFSKSFPNTVREKLEKFDPDIVHIATPDFLGYKALKWAISKNKPIVSSYHTHFASYLKYYKLGLLEPLLWKYLLWFYSKCEQVFVPTESMAETLRAKEIESDLKIWARGIENDSFSPKKRSNEWRKEQGFGRDDIVISFVSRLVWEKNLELFADVLKSLSENYNNVRALVVGDGPAGEGMKKLLPDAVFTGFLQGEDLSTAYASSDIFFFPSDTETFGNVTLEAMASGLPCVVADAAGSKSLIEHNVNGFLAPVGKKDEFYHYVEKLVKDEELRNKMSEKSLRKASLYSWEVINGKLLSYYQDVTDKINRS